MLKFVPKIVVNEFKYQNLVKIVKSRYNKLLSDVMSDVRLQFMCPTNSLLGYIVTKMEAHYTKPIYSTLIRHMDVHPDDCILEVGFGRGNGVDLILERIFLGNGQYYGIELSNYMADLTSSEMINDITQAKAMFSQIGVFNFMPYNTDFFDALFHIDVFYSWNQNNLLENCDEFYRILKPGCPIYCAMDLKRLHRLANYKILSKSDYDPMRYIETLEQSGFGCIKINYEMIDKKGNLDSSSTCNSREVLLIRATKPLKKQEELLPEKILESLEADIKETELNERIARSTMGQSKNVLNERKNMI